MYENGRKEKFFNPDMEGMDTVRNQMWEEQMFESRKFEQTGKCRDYMGNSCETGFIHVIQPGDTLYLLAQKYHVSVSDIMYKNPYTNVYHLRPGDELCIPVLSKK